MPTIHDTPPVAIQNDVNNLSQALHTKISAKTDTNLLIATWNIRQFGSCTRKWLAEDNDRRKRDLRGLRAICEIVSRFDVVAIQEDTGDLRALKGNDELPGLKLGLPYNRHNYCLCRQ